MIFLFGYHNVEKLEIELIKIPNTRLHKVNEEKNPNIPKLRSVVFFGSEPGRDARAMWQQTLQADS